MTGLDPAVLAELCAAHDIGRLRVFGSAARGGAAPGSDVDLIADFTARKSLLELIRIERAFAARLGRSVDLLTEASLSPHLRDRILEEARVVHPAEG